MSSNVKESLSFSVHGTLMESESDRYRCDERRCKGSDSRSATRPSYLSKVGRATPSEARVLALANIMANTTDPQRNILLSSPRSNMIHHDLILLDRAGAQLPLWNNHEFMIVYQMSSNNAAHCRIGMQLITQPRLINTLTTQCNCCRFRLTLLHAFRTAYKSVQANWGLTGTVVGY